MSFPTSQLWASGDCVKLHVLDIERKRLEAFQVRYTDGALEGAVALRGEVGLKDVKHYVTALVNMAWLVTPLAYHR